MRTQIILLACASAVVASPVPLTYGDWSNWQTWQPSWLTSVAPQIKCGSNIPTVSATSPSTCPSQSNLISLFATKWEPYIDSILNNIQIQLTNLTSTEPSVITIISTLKQ